MNSHQWYYLRDNAKYGPLPLATLIDLTRAGQLSPDDLIWTDGMQEWVAASSCLKGNWLDHRQANSPAAQMAVPSPIPDPPIPVPSRLYDKQAKRGPALEKCYVPFLIVLTSIFGLGTLTVGYSYYFGLFAVAIGCSISNFIVARDNRFGTAPFDLVIMVLAAVSLVPLLGWFTQMTALGFVIAALVKKTQP